MQRIRSSCLHIPLTFLCVYHLNTVDNSDNARRSDCLQEYVYPSLFGTPQSQLRPPTSTLLDLIRKHQNHRQPDSDPQEYARSPSRQPSPSTARQPQQPEPAIPPIEQPTHPPEADTKGEMAARSGGRHSKSSMPTHKGLENFKLVSQMGELVTLHTCLISA